MFNTINFIIIKVILDPIEMEFINENKKMIEVYHRSKE